MLKIDLNCDLGESFGEYKIGNDEDILNYVTSANIACGFHGGDPVTMEKTVKMALGKGVALGAHPGFPDLMGFGRRNMQLTTEEVKAYIIYQVGALMGFVKSNGGKLQHVKPHGALYNMAAKDYHLSRAIVEALYALDQDIIFVGLANSQMIKAANDVGLPVAIEVFADRNYQQDGSLVPRNQANAMIHDEEECLNRVLKMVMEKKVETVEGKTLSIHADTLCLHGDHPQSLVFAKRLKEALLANKIEVLPMASIL